MKISEFIIFINFIAPPPASWRFLLFFGGGGAGYISIEDHYLHKKWNFTGLYFVIFLWGIANFFGVGAEF